MNSSIPILNSVMADYYLNNGHHEEARQLFERLVNINYFADCMKVKYLLQNVESPLCFIQIGLNPVSFYPYNVSLAKRIKTKNPSLSTSSLKTDEYIQSLTIPECHFFKRQWIVQKRI